MKTPTPFKSIACLLAILASGALTQAADIILTNSDALNNSSFTNKGFWNSSSAPFAGNNYLTWTNGMRTPQNGLNYTFAGDSLTLSPGALITRNGYSLLEAATAAKTLTVNNFTNAGGIMRSRGGHTFAVTWAGNMYYVASNSAIWADQNGWIITSPLVGGDGVVLTNQANTVAQAQDTISYQGTNSGYTGTLLLTSGTTKFQNLFSGPGNPATLNPRQITLNASTTFQDEVGLSLTNGRGGITLGGAATLTTATLGSNTLISMPIAGAFTLTKNGAGTLTLAGSNTLTAVTLNGATVGSRLNINSTNALGTGTFTINSGDNATIDNTSGSSVTLLANNPQAWNNNFTFAGSNPLNLGNGAVSMPANRTLTINASTLTVGGIISGIGFSLNKVGGGTLALGGVSTYSGATTINGGSLVLNSGASLLNSTSISVAAGTVFDVSAVSFTLGTTNSLGGSGTVNGSIADSAGSQIIPGGSGAVGTLTVTNNLTLAGNDTLRFDIATGSNDLISVGGNLTPNGNTAISLGNLPTVLPSGTYTLIQVAGSLGGSAANFYVTNQPTPSRQAFSIVYATSPNRVQMVVTGDSAPLEWLGTSTAWDLLVTSDWTNSTAFSVDKFYNGDAVSFTDLGVVTQPVLNTNVSPGGVTFNSTGNYLLSGTGAINGGGGLTKAGSSTLTITTTNTYTGVTAINGGVVSVNMFTNAGISQPLGAGSTASGNLTFNSGKLQYTGDTSSSTRGATLNSGGGTVEIVNGATTLAVSGIIAGSSGGSLTKIGNGTLILGGANSYNGSTLVNVGTLTSTNDAIPSGSATVLADTTGVNLVLLANDTIGSLAGGGLNGGNVNLNARTLTYGSDNTSTSYGGIIFGTGGITKVGTGTNTLTGVNTFSGNFFIKNGTVVVDTGGGIATTLWQSIGQDTGDNATLTLKGSGSVSQTTSDFNVGDIGNSIGTVNIQDSASLNVNAFFVASANAAGSTASGTVNQTGGSVTENSTATGAFLLGGRVSALGVGIYNLSGGTLTAAGGLRVGSAGTGIFNQSGSSTFTANGGLNIARLGGSTGTYNLNGGTLITLNITSSTGTNAVLNLNGGTVQPTATANNTTWINNLTTANVRTNATTIDNLGYNVTISQPLVHSTIGGDAAIDAGLIFQGSGTNTLTATNTYNGPTVVNSGTLNVNGVLGTGAVTINGGATLIGIGVLNGATTNASGNIAPAGSSIGTLTISNKLVIQGGTLAFNMTKTSNDVIAVTGALSVESATTASVSFPAPSIGTNTLMTYGSFLGDLANLNLTLTSPNPRYNYFLTNDVAAKAIKLVISGNTNSQGNLVWRGDGSGNNWDNTGTYQNWTNAAQGALDYFYDGDIATFDSLGSTTPAVSITAPVAPSAVTVSSSSTYDFTGNSITSPGNLTKSGAGSLVLENDNTFANASLNGGLVQIGNGGASGSLNAAAITNNTTIVFNRSDAANMAAAISGSGGIQQISTGSAALSGSNSYAGVTLVTAGILYPHNVTALGSAAGNTVATNGGKVYFDQNFDIADENFVLGGAAVQKGGAGVTTLGGTVALVADTTFVLDGGATLNLTNTTGITGSGFSVTFDGGGNAALTGPLALGAGTLTKLGAGILTVGTNNSFTGIATITAGTLNVTDATLGNPAVVTPNQITLNGGTLGNVSSVAFTNGKSGMTVAANSIINVATGTTLLFSNEITGSATLTKAGAGTLILGTSNSFNGTLYLDTTSNSGNDGALRITTSNAIALVATPIYSGNNNGGSSILQLDGTTGDIIVAQDFSVTCRNSGVAWIQNIAGNNTLNGALNVNVGGGTLPFQSDTGTLTLNGALNYVGVLTGGRTYTFLGAGNHVVNGVINVAPNTAPISVAMNGTGILTLNAANTYTNTTSVTAGTLFVNGSILGGAGVTVTGGTLAGTGSIADTVTVSGAGNLAPGANAIGTLTVNSNLTLSGLTTIEVNKTAGTRDQVVGITRVNYGGTLFATNLSGTLNVGDSFAIFTAATRTNNFASITGTPGAGKAWSFNPTNGVLSVVLGVNTTPTNLVAKVNGNTLELSWPTDHIGWRLQAQTNTLATGFNTNWVDVAGSSSVSSVTNIINPASGSVFYRMVYP